MVGKKKKVGYYASRGRCLRAYSLRKINRRTRRTTIKKVNSAGKTLKKGTKIFKTKSACKRHINRRRRSPVRRRRRRNRFGKGCGEYVKPYFGQQVPSVNQLWSGTDDTGISSSAWMWPQPGAEALSKQQGRIIY